MLNLLDDKVIKIQLDQASKQLSLNFKEGKTSQLIQMPSNSHQKSRYVEMNAYYGWKGKVGSRGKEEDEEKQQKHKLKKEEERGGAGAGGNRAEAEGEGAGGRRAKLSGNCPQLR